MTDDTITHEKKLAIAKALGHVATPIIATNPSDPKEVRDIQAKVAARTEKLIEVCGDDPMAWVKAVGYLYGMALILPMLRQFAQKHLALALGKEGEED